VLVHSDGPLLMQLTPASTSRLEPGSVIVQGPMAGADSSAFRQANGRRGRVWVRGVVLAPRGVCGLC
jgi:hypothetical protein